MRTVDLPSEAGVNGRDWFHVVRNDAIGLEALHAGLDTHAYGRHAHETYAVGVCEAGSQTFRCRGAVHCTRPGTAILFEPFDLHDGRASTAEGVVYRMLYVEPDSLRHTLEAEQLGGEPGFASPVVDDPLLARAVVALGRALDEPGEALRVAELHIEFAVAIARVSGRQRPPASPGTDPATRVRDFLHDRFADPVTMEQLARSAGLSRYRMLRAFARRFGVPPSVYLRTLRLEHAKRRLARGESLAEVAAALGFVDQSHLTRWFRRAYGMSPGRYRAAA